ncbi:magnesium/cobalt transporter CorA [Effusibacillus dendaii]|uniref:Magnesium transport protein CorA n=1 Tax=Effusibacillus dendaii TaxID=2743772 RepID=A0A7I8D849_9BACL|nr:magnesium/cobalt transporter CorA [Effusibacillus dendaii]BCJ86187.1 putative metal ion transporter YfjQ [Effusibacillus dendaii]
MIHTLCVLNDGNVLYNVPLEQMDTYSPKWFWVEFSQPTEQEILYLSSYFSFHHLAIEDCLHLLQRPKLDDYGEYRFLVLHAFSQPQTRPEEVNLFVSDRYIVSFHMQVNEDLTHIKEYYQTNPSLVEKGMEYLLYSIIDRLVDQYFPLLHQIDDELDRLESAYFLRPTEKMINRVFEIRKELLALRRTFDPCRDVINQILHPEEEKWKPQHRLFFRDIYDHLTKLLEMTDTYRQIGNDLIESYAMLNSQRINRVMMTLTVITTIFMPLSFLAALYGMNFVNMPELHWRYGYYAVLILMGITATGMVVWFKRKGWF